MQVKEALSVSVTKTVSAKLKAYGPEGDKELILRGALIEICSSLASTFIHKRTYQTAPPEVFRLLFDCLDKKDEGGAFETFKEAINALFVKKQNNLLLTKFKDDQKTSRRASIHKMNPDELKLIAERTLVISESLGNQTDEFRFKITTLDRALSNMKACQRPQSPSHSPSLFQAGGSVVKSVKNDVAFVAESLGATP